MARATGLAGMDGSPRAAEAGGPHDRRATPPPIHLRGLRQFVERLRGPPPARCPGKAPPHRCRRPPSDRAPPPTSCRWARGLGRERVHTAMGGEQPGHESPRRGLHHLQRAPANAPGRSEQGDPQRWVGSMPLRVHETVEEGTGTRRVVRVLRDFARILRASPTGRWAVCRPGFFRRQWDAAMSGRHLGVCRVPRSFSRFLRNRVAKKRDAARRRPADRRPGMGGSNLLWSLIAAGVAGLFRVEPAQHDAGGGALLQRPGAAHPRGWSQGRRRGRAAVRRGRPPRRRRPGRSPADSDLQDVVIAAFQVSGMVREPPVPAAAAEPTMPPIGAGHLRLHAAAVPHGQAAQ